MTQLNPAFEKLGFWESETEEEHITIFGMDFPSEQSYIIITDDAGNTPELASKPIVVACYSDEDCFKWGKELKNFAALEEIAAENPAESKEMLEPLKNYTLPKK
ncbi:MAG: hypothetical protein ACRC8T_01875 [Acidaminococcaceae bacterium]